jgi:cytochrome P450
MFASDSDPLPVRHARPPGPAWKSPRVAPSPRGDPFLGNLRSMRSDPLGLVVGAMHELGDVVRLVFPRAQDVHVVYHPDHVRQVLQDNAKNYNKQTRGFEKVRNVLGNGLLTSEGDFWLRQRRIAQPAFHREKIAAFAQIMARAGEDMVDGWEHAAKSGRPIDVSAEMMRVTLRIVGEALLGADVTREARSIGEALTLVLEDTIQRTMSLVDVPLRYPTPRNRRFLKARGTLDALVHRVIRERRAGGESEPDLVSMFLEVRDPQTGEQMTEAQVRDEVMTMFLAGHETTANALAWTFYCLSKAPSVDRAIAAELRDVLGDRPPTLADLPKLPMVKMALQESMRLYPPAWILGRCAIEEDEIGGYRIPKGSIVFVCPYATHRHRVFWPNPEGFEPERFLPHNEERRSRYAYFPFGGGPRMCIGSAFAMIEAHLVLASVLRRYRLDLVPGYPVEPEPLITLRQKYGLQVHLAPRRP